MKRGISLIVLVVTIIVMIIIAGAVIISLTDTNVIEQAEYASERYRVAMYEEKINLARQEKLLAEYGTTEGVNISVRAVLDITEENEEEYVVNIATANSIPANMPAGTYYKLDEKRYATKTRENERELFLASRGIDRENELVTNTYVVNENFDVYYIISGTIGKPEEEEVNWKYAWTSDGTTWSDIIKADELVEGEKVEGKIVAKIYETDEVIEAFVIDDNRDQEGSFAAGKGYVLDIQGEGEIPALYTVELVPTPKGDDEIITNLVWVKELEKYMYGETNDAIIPYITKIIIGEGITNIPDFMLMRYGDNLKELEISNTVKTIGEDAFAYCWRLESVTIPGNVEIIGEGAFASCKNLSKLIIENGVKEIGEYAFYVGKYELNKLERIVIPASVIKIDDEAFGYRENLKEVYIETTSSELQWGIAVFNLVNNVTIYVRNETIANIIGGTKVSTNYNWVAPII